ncbi:ATP-binding protein [Streptomyces sp. NBC_00268]|uniref:ATP-binding protein n=1 Tax=Streptomyces sp. NBC_00268 TaxID=2975695 RepID=UPI00224FF490|nr:ATP-binding protein [Streptomyces sp. NBC_00268]MCX5182942.1 ATP-binding protein [Streptomyces sp. NBC_00268]
MGCSTSRPRTAGPRHDDHAGGRIRLRRTQRAAPGRTRALKSSSANCYVRFISLDDMVRNLKAAEGAGRLTSKLGSYLRPAVLVVDEVGYQLLERAEANLVFQVISKRYEKGSIILTSNKTFSEWGQVFGDEVLATAILDRLLHHCDVISINGPSYRLKNRLAAIERDTDAA